MKLRRNFEMFETLMESLWLKEKGCGGVGVRRGEEE